MHLLTSLYYIYILLFLHITYRPFSLRTTLPQKMRTSRQALSKTMLLISLTIYKVWCKALLFIFYKPCASFSFISPCTKRLVITTVI